jgi:hypothetical protein
MAIDNPDIVDAIGVEKSTGSLVLTIADEWDWQNEGQHLLALQAKLNGYFRFIESGQIKMEHPEAIGRQVVVDVVGRFPLPKVGLELLKRASNTGDRLGIQVRSRHHP